MEDNNNQQQPQDFDLPQGPPQNQQQQHYQQQRPYYPSPPPPYYGKPAGNKSWMIPVALGIGCLPWILVPILIAVIGMVAGGGGETTPRGNHIALVRVSGVITAGKGSAGMFGSGVAGSEDVIKQLELARKNKGAKAIVIRINSPGGTPSGSEEVYKEIMRIRKEGKPVYTSMADVAASGGYFIASASDKIYADASTLTGSIGVIFETTDMSQLFNKIGLNSQVIKSGKFKDIGSSNRPMTPAEKALLQGLVNDTYNVFVNAVAEGRKLPVSQVKAIADGRVFTGNQAIKVKLVDKIGGLDETIAAAAKSVGISGEPKVREYSESSILSDIFGGAQSSLKQKAAEAVVNALTSDTDTKSGLK